MEFLQNNWVDLAIILFFLVYILGKLKKGFIEGLVDFAGFILSLIFALKFYTFTADIIRAPFDLPHGIANAIGFFVTAFIGEILLFVASALLFKRVHPDILGSKINIYLSFIPAFASALLLSSFFLTAVIVLPVRPYIKQAVATSHIGGFLSTQTIGLERYINGIFGGAIEEALAFMTIKPESNETIDLNFTTQDFTTDAQSESVMLALVNQERTSRGLIPVTHNNELRLVARKHCEDMFKRGYFSHYTPDGLSPFDRMDRDNIEYLAAGENLAYAPDVDIAHEGLMNSPGHKANILSENFEQLGVGVIDAGIYGRMFCQEFSN